MDAAALDWIADALVARIGDRPSPSAMTFLIRRYVASGGDDVRQAVETGLSRGLDAAVSERDPRRRCQWLGVFAEAAVISDDERVTEPIATMLSSTIDDLEGLVRRGYEPGEGFPGARLDDQLYSAAAFLTAFDLTARLPYSMLAEELLQIARRTDWDEGRGTFRGDFAVNASAAQILCRLEALHRDEGYLASAVVARDTTYARDAERILTWLAPLARDHADDAAEYGVALLEWFALSEHPN